MKDPAKTPERKPTAKPPKEAAEQRELERAKRIIAGWTVD